MARTVFNHGAYYAQWAFRNSDGYPMGVQTAPDSVGNDVEMHAYLIRNMRNFTPPTVTFGEVSERGGQKIRGKFKTPATEISNATFELSSDDPVLRTYSNGTSIDSGSPAGWKQYGMNANIAVFPAAFMVFSTRTMIIDDVAQTTTYGWKHYICPNAQLELQQSNITQEDGDTPNPITGTVTLNKAFRALTGELFSATDMNLTEDNDYFYVIETLNPIAITSYTATGSANPETFTLAYLPLTTQATTSDKLLTEEGVTDAITALSISTGILTTATAGAAGNIYVIVYETDYVPSP